MLQSNGINYQGSTIELLKVKQFNISSTTWFLSRHSTCTQLLECLNEWTLSIENHQGVAVGYIDFFRSFDSVVHNKLIVKLASRSIANELLAFIKDFLTDRTQHVVVDGKISSISKVLSGVPQGSVLGPILFILYINYVVDSLPTSTTCKLFADDLKIYSVLNIINDANSILSAFDTIK